MAELGEGVAVTQIADEEDAEDIYALYFKLVDEGGNPLKDIPYKTVVAGTSAEPLHIEDAETLRDGRTFVASSTKDEEIDFYFVWSKLRVNTGFLKF